MFQLRKSERLLKIFFELFCHIGIAKHKNFRASKNFNYNFGAIAQLAVFEKKNTQAVPQKSKSNFFNYGDFFSSD